MKLTKFIIYAEKKNMIKLAHFYRDVIGLTPMGGINKGWNSFEVSEGVTICMHCNNVYEGNPISNLRQSNLVINLDGTFQDLKDMYNRIYQAGYKKVDYIPDNPKYTWNDKIPLKQKQIGYLWTKKNEKTGINSSTFWVLDPVGNMVQIETHWK